VCGVSPALVKVISVPALTRVRFGKYPNSMLLSPIFTASTPSAIGPVCGPATLGGGGGGHSRFTWPLRENVHTASPLALPIP
jgi:hypothetical protein